jgi:hypothetical protein
LASRRAGVILAVCETTTSAQEDAEVEDAVTAGSGEGVPEHAAEGAAPEQPAGVEEPALGGPKDDPQEAIAAHSGMWWPPAIEPEAGESPDTPATEEGAGADAAGGSSPPAEPA